MTTTITPPVAGIAPTRRGGVVRRWYGPLFRARTWKETASLLVALPLGAVWSSVVVTGLSLSAGLIVTLVGLPLLVALVYGGRGIGAVERSMARTLLDTDLPASPPVDRSGSIWTRGRRMLGNGPGWRGLAFGLLALPVGIVTFTAAVVVWTVAAAMAAFPLFAACITRSGIDDVPSVLEPFVDGWARVGSTVAITLVGLLLLALAPRVIHRIADTQRRIVRRILAP